METRALDLLVLNATCDDWENMASIRADVDGNGRIGSVTSFDLETSLLQLVQEGLLDAHVFSGGTFTRLPPESVCPESIARLWYFISPVGRRFLDTSESFFNNPQAP